MPELSLVIPVFNSEENLAALVQEIGKALEWTTYEVIFVNDGSRDRSWQVICELADKDERILGINLRKNSGQDNAIMAGLRHVAGEFVVIMDDDLQHSPHDIRRLYEQCQAGFDVCYANFRRKHQAAWKNFGSWFNGKVAEILLDKPSHIYLSPFEMLRRDVVDEVAKYVGPFPYVQGLILNVTDNLTQADVEHHPRHRGRGNFNLVRSIRVFLKLATNFSVVPLRISSFVGMLVSIFGFGLSIYYLFDYLVNRHKAVEGWTTLILTLLILGGITLMSLGMLGEYVGRMYLSVSDKPPYTIRQIVRKRREP